MNAVRQAQVGYHSDASEKGAAAADNLTTTLSKIRQELQMTAESFATILGPGVELALKGIEKLAGGFEMLMSGPLGKFMQIAAAVAGTGDRAGGWTSAAGRHHRQAVQRLHAAAQRHLLRPEGGPAGRLQDDRRDQRDGAAHRALHLRRR